jgi:tryptophan synthase alpha chain
MRIAKAFAKGRPALMPFIMAGDPSLELTEEIILALVEAGADLIELGVPHTDPLADGPINQAAAGRALAGGTNLHGIMELVARLRRRGIQIPILLLSYLNPLLAFGKELPSLKAAGIDGLIIPDLPPEEHSWFKGANDDLPLIGFVAPTTDRKRQERIVADAQGFLYCISNTGVTGPRGELSGELEEFLTRIKEISPVPTVVGFGIANPLQAAQVGRMAAGVIVGSALVEIIFQEGTERGAEFVRQLRDAL